MFLVRCSTVPSRSRTIFTSHIAKGEKKREKSPSSKWTKKYDPREEREFEKKIKASKPFDAKSIIKRLNPDERLLLRDALLIKDPLPLPEETVQNDEVEEPTTRQLGHLFMHQALPFVGFGFLDNLIMILAGEYIDATIGITLGISTMAAAGLGNTISDLFGIASANIVERLASKIFKGETAPPPLTLAQLESTKCRAYANAGRAVGVTTGCLLGMFPLLFQ